MTGVELLLGHLVTPTMPTRAFNTPAMEYFSPQPELFNNPGLARLKYPFIV
jgi:hypothetical protein